MVAHSHNSSTGKAEARGSQDSGHLSHRETPSQNNNNKIDKGTVLVGHLTAVVSW
jgi:hypothetical protein